MGDVWVEFGEVVQFLFGYVDLVEQGIGKDFVEFGEEMVFVCGGEVVQIEIVGFGQLQQDLCGYWVLVVFDQVDVVW